MRKRERIQPFLQEIGKIWAEECPDWRFGQLLVNVIGSFDGDPFFMEEDEFLDKFKQYFHK